MPPRDAEVVEKQLLTWPFADERLHPALAAVLAEAREAQRLRPDAAIGAVVWRFIDRMNDVAPESGDSAERILSEFTAAVRPHIDAALGAKP